jgi:hypothetical protein
MATILLHNQSIKFAFFTHPLRALRLSLIFFLLPVSVSMAGDGNDEIQRTLDFAGYSWTVRTGSGGPGPNNWSNSAESVWLDDKGYLHMKIRKVNNSWYCSEIYTNHYTQYGKHKFVVEGDIDNPDQNTVLGLFTYADDTHEIDIEFSHWGNLNYSELASYTIQPYAVSGNSYPFEVQIDSMVSTHLFDWQENFIAFTSYQGEKNTPANLLKNWVYTGAYIPKDTDQLRTHINFWLFQGKAPVDTSNLEVIIRHVEQPQPLGTGIDNGKSIKNKSFYLNQNYPNPFNSGTIISWQLAVGSNVELSVYNLSGAKVTTLVSEKMAAGHHSYNFAGNNLASGIYYYQLIAGDLRDVRKMILLQ